MGPEYFTSHRVRLASGVFIAWLIFGCRDDKPRSAEEAKVAPRGTGAAPFFVDVTGRIGVSFTHENGADGSLLMPEIMASGVALFDFDNDGDLDLYLTNGQFGLRDTNVSPRATNHLYRQEADGTFVNVTDRSGLGDTGYGMGVGIGDMDNDGYLDVYVANLGADQLYRNRGDGTFENITQRAGIHVDRWSSSVVFFDYDRDGYLDLYVTEYVNWVPEKNCFSEVGAPEYCGPKSFAPIHDVLLRNNGNGTFTDTTAQAGIDTVAAAGLGVVADDLNDDGWPDIYAANDAYANQLWINQKDGTFRDEALLSGAAFNLHGMPEAGMGVVAADFDNDDDLDLFMTHLLGETNTYYRNDGETGFSDTTGTAGLAFSSVAYTGFGVAAFDAELDGDLDILLVNGRVYHEEALPGCRLPPPWNRLAEPNLFYLNDGKAGFKLANHHAAAVCDPIEISRGLALGDIDDDGDLDLVVTNIKSPTRVYRNDAPRAGHWLSIRAIDPRLKRDAIGARIRVFSDAGRVSRTVVSTAGYQSSGDLRAHFGLGAISKVNHVEIRWPDGLVESFPGPRLDRAVVLYRGEGTRKNTP